MSRAKTRILLVLIGGLLGLAAVEAALHFVRLAPVQRLRRHLQYTANWQSVGVTKFPMNTSHETQGWAYVPDSEFAYGGKGKRNEYYVHVKINSKGLRDREYSYEKGRDNLRILVLGDSFSAALQVPLEQSWHEILERKFTENPPAGKKIEVINAAVSGYGTDQELLYYRHEGYKYAPDIVLLEVYVNDFFDNYPEASDPGARQRKPFFVLTGDRLELKNFPYRGDGYAPSTASEMFPFSTYLFKPVIKRVSRTLDRVRDLTGVPRQLLIYAPHYPPQIQAAWELTTRLIGELSAEATKRNAKLAVLFIPAKRSVYPAAWEQTLAKYPRAKGAEWDLEKPNRMLGDVLRQAGIGYLDLTPHFQESVKERGEGVYFGRDEHLAPMGHSLVAELGYEWLLKEGLVPR